MSFSTACLSSFSVDACLNGVIPLIYLSRPNSSTLLNACSNGLSEMVEELSALLIFVFYNFQLLRFIGEDGVATFGMVVLVEGIFTAVFYGLALVADSVVGYHFGAKNYRELKSLLQKGVVLNIFFGLLMFFTARWTAPCISEIYLGYDPAVCKLARHALSVFAFTLQDFNEIFSNADNFRIAVDFGRGGLAYSVSSRRNVCRRCCRADVPKISP